MIDSILIIIWLPFYTIILSFASIDRSSFVLGLILILNILGSIYRKFRELSFWSYIFLLLFLVRLFNYFIFVNLICFRLMFIVFNLLISMNPIKMVFDIVFNLLMSMNPIKMVFDILAYFIHRLHRLWWFRLISYCFKICLFLIGKLAFILWFISLLWFYHRFLIIYLRPGSSWLFRVYALIFGNLALSILVSFRNHFTLLLIFSFLYLFSLYGFFYMAYILRNSRNYVFTFCLNSI